MASFAGSPPNFPALVLFPLTDTFQAKNIVLHQRSKIGRQSNAKTIPTDRNGYFDTKVISRQHAEVWVEDGKIWIKDVKSSNGTYVNTHRLAPEGVESDPFELHTGDILELGTDIASEDNSKILHHKVAARVTCILTAEDAAVYSASRQQPQDPQQGQFTFGQSAPPRRPMSQMNQMAMNSMGGLGASTRAPGTRSGLSFDHIMSKIQSELQKSRDTGAELHGLANAMNDIQDTLGGSLPIVPSQQPRPASLVGPLAPPAPQPTPAAPPPEYSQLQSQISETQSWIAGQVDRLKTLDLDNVASEFAALRRDFDVLRELVQSQRATQDVVSRSDGAVSPVARELEQDDDDDDARSVATLMPGDADDKEFAFSADDAHSVSRGQFYRDDEAARQLESVMSLARELERQHAESNETIRALQDKVLELEARESSRGTTLEDKVRALEGRQDAHEERTTAMQQALVGTRVEWSSLREDWVSERARIAKAVDDFEATKTQAARIVAEARAPPSPPKSLTTDSDSASGDPGEESTGRHVVIASPIKRKKNRRRKSPVRRGGLSGAATDASEMNGRDEADGEHEGDGDTGEWEPKAPLTPSSLSSSSSNARRFQNGQLNSSVDAGRDSVRSSIDSLLEPNGETPADADVTPASVGKAYIATSAASSRTTANSIQHNLTPIAGTVAFCVVALAIAYGRDLRLVT
ncbi:hypothetical protein BKA62DRAFT_720590 [Auriculariales sp. MPI-PUGE-AT-0066]|nr:hypothetical protein BKA62DRAFT_720590 [Auriculariales sp. MPI-PUGE-AT-0066]